MDISEGVLRRMAVVLDDEQFARMYSPDGLARTAQWHAEDGYIIAYTTSRIRHGRLNGLFAVLIYEPRPNGTWERVKLERCDTRREAKQRALKHYYEHSPKRAKRHRWTGDGYEAR